MSSRLHQTLTDYVVIGICPSLIGLLVGSLMFFLTEVFYHGQFYHRLLWVIACFVVATVGIARISMEEGTAYASMYALPLALAVSMATVTFVKIEGPLAAVSGPINLGMMGFIWWCTHKLVWDCTLIDDEQDSSGQGLLQSLGWSREEQPAAAEPEATSSVEAPAAPDGALPEEWWHKWLKRDKRPHAPGVWVIYFSLAALPLFGLGQWFIPVEDLESRRYVFKLLVVYAASGLGLLLTTSFLGLRRYLRQRRLEMPGDMAATWLGVGVVMIVVLLIFVSLLPRPSPEYSITHLAPNFTSPDRDASEHGFGEEGANDTEQSNATATQGQEQDPQASGSTGEQQSSETGEGKDGSKQSSGGEQKSGERGDRQAGESASGKSQPGNSGDKGKVGDKGKSKPGGKGNKDKEGSQGKPGEKQTDGGGSGSKQQSDRQNTEQDHSTSEASNPPDSQPAAKPPKPPSTLSAANVLSGLASFLGGMMKWLFFLAVLAVTVYLAWKNRDEIIAAWNKLLAAIRDLWAKLFGGSPAEAVTAADAAPAVAASPPPFSSFADPFASGLAARVSLAELVRYTFTALEAWGRERDAPRTAGQTPHEFAYQLGRAAPAVAGEARQLAEIYGQLAYSNGHVHKSSMEHVRQLWRKLSP